MFHHYTLISEIFNVLVVRKNLFWWKYLLKTQIIADMFPYQSKIYKIVSQSFQVFELPRVSSFPCLTARRSLDEAVIFFVVLSILHTRLSNTRKTRKNVLHRAQ